MKSKLKEAILPLLAVLLLAPPTAMHAAETISLAGEWRFQIAGTNSAVCPPVLTNKIKLPGTMDDAGLGPKNTKLPTLAGPYRLYDYAGPAWYQRDIDVPADWRGNRVTLFLERCRWTTTVWLDDQRIGSQDSLIAPHVYDFGTGVSPGKHRLTICVDNTVKLDLGKFVSVLFGGTYGNMNGIIGRIELAATPPVWIDEVQVYPDVDKKLARVVVKIANATDQPGHGRLNVGKQSMEATWDEKGGSAEVDVDMSEAKLWDEFSPNLSEVTVKLGDDQRTVHFGMRKFSTRGTQFTLNDRPVFLRGTVESMVFPLTGYPPMEVAAWRRIFRIEKSYGMNFIRCHSWCPPEAAFAAADLEGIMIQAEGPQANVEAGANPDRDAFLQAELGRMVDIYGNHPSFCLVALGNEFSSKKNSFKPVNDVVGVVLPVDGKVTDTNDLLTGWVEHLEQKDPRHLYTATEYVRTTPNRQWTENRAGRGIFAPGTERDVRDAVAGDPHPIIGHEIAQWTFFPDFKEMKKWTGVMALKNFGIIQQDMENKHLLDLEPKYVEACGRFALLLYKEEIEALLRTPGYGGFSLLALNDYPTQGTAVVGPLDAFWDSKGFITPAAFRQFCSATVPLLRMPKRTYMSDETFMAAAEIAHYAAADLLNVKPAWSIKDEAGHTVASGSLPALNVPTGKLTPLGEIRVPLANFHAPGKFTVTVSLADTKFENDWEIWVYPAKIALQPPANVVVTENWDAAKSALAEGKKVVFFPVSTNSPLVMNGSYTPVFWSPVWFPKRYPNTMSLLCDPQNPLFAQFPTEIHSNWQWYELMQRSRLFILDDTAPDYRPLLQVIDNFARNHKLGVIFEGRVGTGQLLVSGMDLPQMTDFPEARQLLASLYAYVGSEQFQPAAPLSVRLLDTLFTTSKPNAAFSK